MAGRKKLFFPPRMVKLCHLRKVSAKALQQLLIFHQEGFGSQPAIVDRDHHPSARLEDAGELHADCRESNQWKAVPTVMKSTE